MWHLVKMVLGAGLLLGLASAASAQGVVDYPPATGHMQVIPPSYPGAGAVGSQYVETFPSFGETYQSVPYAARPVAPNAVPAAPRVRGRGLRGGRTYYYSRGYRQPPAPYATQLPQGQLYWPGSYLTPGYTPFSRYQTYGSGYWQSPYGSNFWGGYYKGYSLSN
jgi:hypothetical protein